MSAHSLTRPFAIVVAATALLLSVPLVAMRFTREVNWSVGDFFAAGFLLISSGTAIVFGLRRATSGRGKAFVIAAVLAILMLVWAHLAVGLFS